MPPNVEIELSGCVLTLRITLCSECAICVAALPKLTPWARMENIIKTLVFCPRCGVGNLPDRSLEQTGAMLTGSLGRIRSKG